MGNDRPHISKRLNKSGTLCKSRRLRINLPNRINGYARINDKIVNNPELQFADDLEIMLQQKVIVLVNAHHY